MIELINTGIWGIVIIASVIGTGFLLNYKNQREWDKWNMPHKQ